MSLETILYFDNESYEKLEARVEKELFVFQWLTNVEKTVRGYKKPQFKPIQPLILPHLQECLRTEHGPPNRRLLANAFAVVIRSWRLILDV